MRRFPLPTILVACVLVLIFGIYACTFQVRFSEVVVKVWLGQADDSSAFTSAGLKFKWPYPIERVVKYDRRLRTLDTAEGEVKTRDGKNVIFGAYALWQIADPLQYYRSAPNEVEAINQMRARLNQVRAAVVGRREMVAFVNLDEEASDRAYDEIEKEMLDEVHDSILADYGVEIVRFELRRNTLPMQATRTVFDQMRKEREIKATQYRQEGISIADAIRAKAEADATQIEVFARRRAQEISSAGVQASTRILARIETEDREFFEWLRWLEAMDNSLRQRTTFFIDTNSPMWQIFNNPTVPRSLSPLEDEMRDADVDE